jgi:hypothetical protein
MFLNLLSLLIYYLSSRQLFFTNHKDLISSLHDGYQELISFLTFGNDSIVTTSDPLFMKGVFHTFLENVMFDKSLVYCLGSSGSPVPWQLGIGYADKVALIEDSVYSSVFIICGGAVLLTKVCENPTFRNYYSKNGFFIFYYTVSFLVLFVLIIEPMSFNVSLEGMGDIKLLVSKMIVELSSIVYAMIIALLLAVVLTDDEHINNRMSYYHFLLITENLIYVRFILKLHVIRCKLYESDIQKYQVYFLLVSLFVNYLVTGNEKSLYGFLVMLYSSIYCEYFILRVMPYSVSDMDEISVVMQFLTNLRYRYLDNKFPILLGGDMFNDYRGYCFGAATEEFFNYMHVHYMRIECCEYLADHSIPLGEKLKGCQKRLQNYKNMLMTDETKLMMDFLIDEIDELEYLLKAEAEWDAYVLEEEAEWEASLEAYLNSDPDYLEYKLKEEAFWDEYIKNSDSDDSDDQEF